MPSDTQDVMKFSSDAEAEEQLRALQKDLRFAVHEPTVELCVAKLNSGDYRIPEYQRELTWDPYRMSKFIESVLLGLPIPFIFGVAEEDFNDRIAIIDGRQRPGTLKNFLEDVLVLSDVEKLDRLEGFRFSDLSELQQRRFRNRPIRMVVLDGADTSTQFDMFERLNTTGKIPQRAEIRRGAFPGAFTNLVVRLAEQPTFVSLTPMREGSVDQREREELVLRLLCYANEYQNFRHSVTKILDDYMRDQNVVAAKEPSTLTAHEAEFERVCAFAKENLPGHSFARPGRVQTPRVRFEGLAIGIALALRARPELKKADMSWVEEKEFDDLTQTDASNSRPKLTRRIEFVRDRLMRI